jgi:hypothetical protein
MCELPDIEMLNATPMLWVVRVRVRATRRLSGNGRFAKFAQPVIDRFARYPGLGFDLALA